jgi:hypothetical protein
MTTFYDILPSVCEKLTDFISFSSFTTLMASGDKYVMDMIRRDIRRLNVISGADEFYFDRKTEVMPQISVIHTESARVIDMQFMATYPNISILIASNAHLHLLPEKIDTYKVKSSFHESETKEKQSTLTCKRRKISSNELFCYKCMKCDKHIDMPGWTLLCWSCYHTSLQTLKYNEYGLRALDNVGSCAISFDVHPRDQDEKRFDGFLKCLEQNPKVTRLHIINEISADDFKSMMKRLPKTIASVIVQYPYGPRYVLESIPSSVKELVLIERAEETDVEHLNLKNLEKLTFILRIDTTISTSLRAKFPHVCISCSR